MRNAESQCILLQADRDMIIYVLVPCVCCCIWSVQLCATYRFDECALDLWWEGGRGGDGDGSHKSRSLI